MRPVSSSFPGFLNTDSPSNFCHFSMPSYLAYMHMIVIYAISSLIHQIRIFTRINDDMSLRMNFFFVFRPLETPEQNVRRLANKPDIVLPHPDCVDSILEEMTICNCCPVIYCSEACKSVAYDKYHRQLCYDFNDTNHPISLLLDAWKYVEIFLPLLIALSFSLKIPSRVL